MECFKKKKLKAAFPLLKPLAYIYYFVVCVWVCVRVLPVSMWSTGLNMWSDVRGKLLTLKPLSVLSLREWALHKEQTEFLSVIPDHHLLDSRSNRQWKLWLISEQTKCLDYAIIIPGNSFVFTEISLYLRNISHENCLWVDKWRKWDICFLDTHTLVLSAGHMVFYLCPLYDGGSRSNVQKNEITWVAFRKGAIL